MSSKKLAVAEEPEKTRKCLWDGPLLTEQTDQKNYGILRDTSKGQENQ